MNGPRKTRPRIPVTYVGQSASAAQQPADETGDRQGRRRGVRRADQAAGDRAPAADDRAGDVLRRPGVPDLGLVVATVVGGTFSAGSASVFNCVYDRDIDEQMRRTRRRALPRHIVSPRSALVFGFVLGDPVDGGPLRLGQPAVGAAVGDRQRVLRLRLHDAAQAAHDAEHRLGRPRRLLPGADRLDRRHRLAVLDAGRAVHGRLLLDAAAHLGAGAALPRGLRQRRRPDAAGGQARPPRSAARS